MYKRQGQTPSDPADEIRRRGELSRELAKLRTENARLYNEQALIQEMRKRRLAESRQKQQETKARHERERQERAQKWREKKQHEIVFLGEKVSGGLNYTECDEARLNHNGLPAFSTAEDIAAAMGISLSDLRFLAFDRKTSTVSHYVRFKIPKKTGGERLISAPKPHLKACLLYTSGCPTSNVGN